MDQPSLPIDPVLPEICDRLGSTSGLLLVAPPGAGKTTRVPRALLDRDFAARGEIVVLEPRRLAARMAARRVAEELGEEVGKTVGYTMRFEDASSEATRVRFVTEGTLTRKLVSDPELRGVACVLLDEAHERSLMADVALALLRRLQLGARPDLKLVAMSATLDAEPMAAFLGAEIVKSEGRRFDVAIEHLPQRDERPLEAQIAGAVRKLVSEGLDGDVLVFLPGALEIRRAGEALASIARAENLLVLPLHGSLSVAEQDRAVRPQDRRKIVLATNVAETSLTIDGVVAVVDSGLARIASHDPWSGLPTLRIAKIARASATQRAGRAGRTRPGRCLRLYTTGDFTARPEHEAPEIARADLAETVLELAGAGVTDLDGFGWFEAPPAASLAHARRLLERLGAIDDRCGDSAPRSVDARALTATGQRMLRFPAHPRLARLIVEAERRGVGGDGATIAALLGERDIASSRRRETSSRHGSDVTEMLDRFDEAKGVRFDPDRLRWMGLEPARAAAVGRVERQLARLVDKRAPRPGSPEAHERAIGLAVLAGYPDRVGRLRRPAHATGRAAREVVFAAGGTAALAPESGVADTDLVVCVDVEERTEGRTRAAVVRVASATDVDALIELFTDEIKDETDVVWNASAERVESVRRMTYDGLVLEEKRGGAPDPIAAAKVLAAAVRAKGVAAFTNDDALDAFLARVAFARASAPELGLPALDASAIDAQLDTICEGASSFADLRQIAIGARIRALLTHEQARAVEAIAPESVTLAHGRRVRLTYPPGGAPHAASRLQDFFGMKDGPRVARGAVPVVLELLAPNRRAVQVTTDLAGFWSRHYPAIAKELRRRYPRHAWPDDPLQPPPRNG